MIARSEISTSFDKTLGGKIRSCPRSMGLSQEKVVQELSFYGLDICQQLYAKIEMGLRMASPFELLTIARVLNIDLTAFEVEELTTSSPAGRSLTVFYQRQ